MFVNTGPNPEPLADALGSMPAQVAELGLDVDELVHYRRWETELDANWKVVCEVLFGWRLVEEDIPSLWMVCVVMELFCITNESLALTVMVPAFPVPVLLAEMLAPFITAT